MQPKNKVTASMLAFFTGFIGGHKLYLGRYGGFIGFFFLFMLSMMMGFPLSMIIGVIQGIKMLKMSDQEFDKKYNRGFIAERRGPLEMRREEQMRRYEQMPEKKGQQTVRQKPSPTNMLRANPYKNSGIKKYKDFDLDDAIADFKKGLEIAPNDVALHFNIACAYSLTEKKALAYHHLHKAVSGGLKDSERILSHDDLAYVRIQPEFEAFRAGGFSVNPFQTPETKKDQPIHAKEKSGNIDKNDAVLDDALLVQINKLSELRNKGILSDDEFIFERKKILRQ
jgi:TM2 domain-containing membrane protein YozV